LQPVRPVNVQLPEISPPFAVPCRVSTLFGGTADTVETVMEKAPVTLPLKSPLKANDPDCVVCPVKQLPVVEKVKLVTVNDELLLVWLNDVVKAKAGEPSGFDKVADQLPLSVPALLLLDPPHPLRASPKVSRTP